MVMRDFDQSAWAAPIIIAGLGRNTQTPESRHEAPISRQGLLLVERNPRPFNLLVGLGFRLHSTEYLSTIRSGKFLTAIK